MWFRVTWLCLEPEKVDVVTHYTGQSKTGRLSDPPFTKCSAHKLEYTEQLEVITMAAFIGLLTSQTAHPTRDATNHWECVAHGCVVFRMFFGLGFHLVAMLSV